GVVPTGFVPPVEAIANWNFFTGRPIDPRSTQDLSPHLRSKLGTSGFAKSVSAGLYAMGKKFGTRSLSVSPNAIDHILFGYTGTAGRTAVRLADSLVPRDARPPAMRPVDYPFVGALM